MSNLSDSCSTRDDPNVLDDEKEVESSAEGSISPDKSLMCPLPIDDWDLEHSSSPLPLPSDASVVAQSQEQQGPNHHHTTTTTAGGEPYVLAGLHYGGSVVAQSQVQQEGPNHHHHHQYQQEFSTTTTTAGGEGEPHFPTSGDQLRQDPVNDWTFISAEATIKDHCSAIAHGAKAHRELSLGQALASRRGAEFFLGNLHCYVLHPNEFIIAQLNMEKAEGFCDPLQPGYCRPTAELLFCAVIRQGHCTFDDGSVTNWTSVIVLIRFLAKKAGVPFYGPSVCPKGEIAVLLASKDDLGKLCALSRKYKLTNIGIISVDENLTQCPDAAKKALRDLDFRPLGKRGMVDISTYLNPRHYWIRKFEVSLPPLPLDCGYRWYPDNAKWLQTEFDKAREVEKKSN